MLGIKKQVAVGLTVCVIASALGACSGGQSSTQEVEALWFGRQADGSMQQGVTPVEIQLSQADSGYKVDLSGFEKAGTGATWNSAAHAATTVAIMQAGVDPRDVQLKFGVGESIDGASAGGLLTVGVRSSLARSQVSPNKSMTGIILPDGSIGPVEGIPSKLRGAQEAGLSEVLVPAGPTRIKDPETGAFVDVVEQGAQLGVQVRQVATVDQAYEQLVGPLDDEKLESPEPIDAQVEQTLLKASRKMLVRISVTPISPAPTAELKNFRQGLVDGVKEAKGLTQAALAKKDPQSAFTSIALARRSVVKWNKTAAAARRISRDGLSIVAQEVRAEAEATKAAVRARALEVAQSPVTKVEQLAALVDALTWAMDSNALVTSALEELDREPELTEARLVELVGRVAEADYDAMTLMPIAADVAMEVGHEEVSDLNGMIAYLGSYADFVNQAATANVQYFQQLHGDGRDFPDELDSILLAYSGDAWKELNELQTQAAVIAKAAQAISRYTASSAGILTFQTLRSSSREKDGSRVRIVDQQEFNRQVGTSISILGRQVKVMAGRDLDSSYVRWQSNWGRGLDMLPDQSMVPDAFRKDGLTYQWFANIGSYLTIALANFNDEPVRN